jgi:hypothetical protein
MIAQEHAPMENAARTLSVADRLEIHELIAQYNIAEDSGEVDAWVCTFTQDGSFFGLRSGVTVTGHDELRRFMIKRLERPGVRQYVHWTSNIIITPTEEGARSRCYVMTVEQMPDASFRVRSMALKNDELRQEDGHWRFKSRVNSPWPDVEPGR